MSDDFANGYKKGPMNRVIATEHSTEEKLKKTRRQILCLQSFTAKKLPVPQAESEVNEASCRLKPLTGGSAYQLVVPQTLRNSTLRVLHLPLLVSYPSLSERNQCFTDRICGGIYASIWKVGRFANNSR